MVSLWRVLAAVVAHYLADWCFQTDWMALNKSSWWKSLEGFKALTTHVGVYSLIMTLIMGTHTTNNAFYLWFLITFVTHWITDAITSQFTTAYWFVRIVEPRGGGYSYDHWDMAKRSKFFNTIGLDQCIHYATLLLTLHLLK